MPPCYDNIMTSYSLQVVSIGEWPEWAGSQLSRPSRLICIIHSSNRLYSRLYRVNGVLRSDKRERVVDEESRSLTDNKSRPEQVVDSARCTMVTGTK